MVDIAKAMENKPQKERGCIITNDINHKYIKLTIYR